MPPLNLHSAAYNTSMLFIKTEAQPVFALRMTAHQYILPYQYKVVLCDTRDTSILIVDTYVTIPVSPKSRYTAVYRSSEKYRETAQVSRVSMIPRVSYHWTTSSLQVHDAKTNVINSLTVKHCASTTTLPISGKYCYQGRTDSLWTKNQYSNFKDFC